MKPLKCAIYTRKSSDEGLDTAFNSLDAQREAGLDYIKSQKHEGWQAITTTYDDGGYSGGTMKRPGLDALLEDIKRGRIDVVVVYKVDRLSRSLTDFAQMMQTFDEHQVSFVSVTQQFNTTTSMGRLTLNMLLSFAQFEREVSGERIRDKIAATKKQGYWVCGQQPLGYRLQHEDESRGIYVIEEDARLVNTIYKTYLDKKSLVDVAESLNQQGHTTKRWLSSTGKWHDGKPLTQKYIYRILTNPVYIAKIVHKRGDQVELYEGRHQAIIDKALWDKVQASIESTQSRTRHRWLHPHLLKGKLRTHVDFVMSPTSVHRPASKKTGPKQKRLVRYYVSQKAIKHGFKNCEIKSINANHIDELVRGVVLDHLDCEVLSAQPGEVRDHWIRKAVAQVVVAPRLFTIHLDHQQMAQMNHYDFGVMPSTINPRPTCPYQPEIKENTNTTTLELKIQIKRLDGRRMLLSPEGHDLVLPSNPEPKPHIVNAIGLAYRYQRELAKSGETITSLCNRVKLADRRVRELLSLTLLSPKVLEKALTGTLMPSTTLDNLFEAAKFITWQEQASYLGLQQQHQH